MQNPRADTELVDAASSSMGTRIFEARADGAPGFDGAGLTGGVCARSLSGFFTAAVRCADRPSFRMTPRGRWGNPMSQDRDMGHPDLTVLG